MVGAGLGEPTAEMLDSMEKSPNFDFFFRHYVVGLGRYELNVAALKGAPCRIIPAVGADAAGQFAHLGGLGLAKILGTGAAVFPGGHGGFMSHPADFANRLREVLNHQHSAEQLIPTAAPNEGIAQDLVIGVTTLKSHINGTFESSAPQAA